MNLSFRSTEYFLKIFAIPIDSSNSHRFYVNFTFIDRYSHEIHFYYIFQGSKSLTIARRIVKFTLNLSALSDQLKSFHCFYGQSIPKYFLFAFNLFFFFNSRNILSTPNDRNKFPRAMMRNEKNLTYTRRCAFVSALKWTKKIIQFFYYHTSFECNNNRQATPRPNGEKITKSSKEKKTKVG